MMVTLSGQNFTNHSVQPIMQSQSYRPDWILYTVPSLGFLLGLCLFLFLLKTQRRQRLEVKDLRTDGGMQAERRMNTITYHGSEDLQKANSASVETVSYENIDMAVYSNQEAVTKFADNESQDDYVLPSGNEDATQPETQESFNDCYSAQNETDSDRESYENMAAPLYVQPRRRRKGESLDDEDYVNPDQETLPVEGGCHVPFSEDQYDMGKLEGCCDRPDVCVRQGLVRGFISPPRHQPPFVLSDGESYEYMHDLYDLHPDYYQEEEDSYEKMESINRVDAVEGAWLQDHGWRQV